MKKIYIILAILIYNCSYSQNNGTFQISSLMVDTIKGGVNAGESLILLSTSNNAKGNIRLGGDTTKYFNYNETSNVTSIGNSNSGANRTQFDSDGSLTLFGSARKKKELRVYAYNIYGTSYTYLGQTYSAGTATNIIGSNNNNYIGIRMSNSRRCFIYTIYLPTDYQSGTDIEVNIYYYTSTTSATSINWIVGVTTNSIGDDIYNATPVYVEQSTTPSQTQYILNKVLLTFTGTTFTGGDEINIVVLRNGSADSYNGDVYVLESGISYISNSLGGTF